MALALWIRKLPETTVTPIPPECVPPRAVGPDLFKALRQQPDDAIAREVTFDAAAEIEPGADQAFFVRLQILVVHRRSVRPPNWY